MKHNLTCHYCGKEFVSPSIKKTCSRECSIALSAAKRDRKVSCTCEVCGKTEYRSPSHAHRRYCSLECKGIASRTIRPRICPTCKQEFTPPSNHGNQAFCSNVCAGKNRRRNVVATCPICGKDFKRRGKRTPHYCSKECMSIGYSKVIEPIPCAYCGTIFTPKKRGSVHCSPKCTAKAGASPRIRLVPCVCRECGKREMRLTRQRRVYCSPECKRAALSRKRTFHRFTENQKNAIKARDNYQCVICGSPDRIQVDHISPIGLGGENTLANGQTLCHSCHVKKTTGDRASIRLIRVLRFSDN